MKKSAKYFWMTGVLALGAFALWTILVQTVDVRPAGETRTMVGFASLNGWIHQLTGVHMELYTLTDWLGLVPVLVCLLFGGVGLVQLLQRKSLRKVDRDILLLGIYYLLSVGCYLLFEVVPINYRPVLIEGRMEASYPSSTTLLVLSVMPTLVFQAGRRLKNRKTQKVIGAFAVAFSLFMVVGRLISGVHWITDIVGSVLLGSGLFLIYRAAVELLGKKQG
jgi:undecaprenyl-diphosphatase